jgi:hypothetical protein
VTFLRLRPTSEFYPDSCAHTACARSPEVSHPRSATHSPRSTIPGLCLPGSRCVLALTMCLDALLPRRAPWCPFNQVRSRGDSPSELDLTEIVTFSRCDIPSCDWLSLPRSVRHKAYCVRASPRLANPPGLALRTSRSWSLSDHRHLPRFRRMRHCCTQRLRFRGLIPLPVGVSTDRFLGFLAPWLSWTLPPWGVPLPCPWA